MLRTGILVACAAALCLAGEAAVAHGLASPGYPKGNPGEWIKSDDYPKEARASHIEGIAVFKLSIDTSGAVTDCLITASSGSAALDDTTCQLLRERAKFQPATDARGRPVQGTYTNRVRWILPRRPVLPCQILTVHGTPDNFKAEPVC